MFDSFDGSHRSRREVNLNTRVRRGRQPRASGTGIGGVGPGNKNDILSNAATLRKERQEQQRQRMAARNIQRTFLGWKSRRQLAQELSVRMKEFQQGTTDNNNAAVRNKDNNWEAITSMRLSRYMKPFLSNFRQVLLEGAACPSTHAWASRLSSSLWFSQKRIVHAVLQEFHPCQNEDEADIMELQTLRCILHDYFASTPSSSSSILPPRIDASLFLDLVACTRAWWLQQSVVPSYSNGKQSSSLSWYDETTRSLFKWSLQAAQGLPSSSQDLSLQISPSQPSSVSFALALLASIIMGTSGLFRSEQSQRFQELLPPELYAKNSDNGDTDGSSSNFDYYYTSWFLPLASCLEYYTTSPANNNAMSDTDNNSSNILLQATLQNFKGYEAIILSNALDLCNPAAHTTLNPQPLIRLLHHVFVGRPDLAMLSSLVVRGENLQKVLDSSTAAAAAAAATNATTNNNNVYEEDGDDELDEETERDDAAEAASAGAYAQVVVANKKSRKSSSARFTRQDLLTMPKLDQHYQEDVQLYRRECLMNLVSSKNERMVELATKIGTTASTWLQWGLVLLNLPTSSDDNKTSSTFIAARDSYLALLGILLQSSTGLRTNSTVASSTFVSKLAFHKEFRENLWYDVQQESATPMALAVFCDLFCHYLIPLSDVEFLRQHTQATTRYRTQIIAEEVIIHLRNALYELYWNKPVLAADVRMHSHDGGRGRLLLAGTKLWNSLYERWNRLVRHSPFCDEATWWFPHLATREGDGAVIPSRERRSNSDDDDDESVEAMDVDGIDEGGGNQMSTADAETDALADSFRDPRMARVLTRIPQALPFERRVKLFHSLLKADKIKTHREALNYQRASAMRMDDDDDPMFDFMPAREQVQIHRASLYNDSMEKLNALGPRLKRQVQVSFINQHGVPEAGIDGGGVFKEFLDDLIKEAFSTANGDERESPLLFSETPLQTLAVSANMNPSNREESQRLLEHYTYIGRVLGKALYESILVEPQFCLPFLNQLLGKANSLEDLKNYDKEMYTNLSKLRDYNEDEVESLGFTFELTIGDSSSSKPGSLRTVELVPGGRSKAVTKQNVIHYIHLVANHRLNVQGAQQTRAFLQGFRDLIPASWVRLFSANELQKLISGDDSVRGIDVASLKRAMQYAAGYHPSQPYIQDFWEIMENDFTPQQQQKFLKFMTSCSRQPLLGFSSLEPAPCIQQIRLSDEEARTKNSRLPTSATCMNLLKLPNYYDKEKLRTKLLVAIEAEAGFELT
jgi:ubiquitin-protein ligase E3 C